MNAKTRFLMALNHEEPDRVPLFEIGVDSVPVLKKYGGKSLADMVNLMKLGRFILGWKQIFGWIVTRKYTLKLLGKSVVKLFKSMGYDATVVPVTLFLTKKKKFLSTTRYVDEYGRVMKFSKVESGGEMVSIAYYDGGFFDTDDPEAAYDEWGPLDPDHRTRAAAYQGAIKEAKDQIYVFPGIMGFLESSWECFGFPTFTKLLYTKPHFIERVFRDHGDFSVAVAENMMNLGAKTVFVYDDAGHKSGPFLSPKMYQKLVIPHLKRLCDKVHSYDGKVILHSDGNLYKILDMIVNAGIDGLHPIEAGSGMDIFQIKQDYGERICLIGNVDPIELLTHGTPEKVERYVKRLIQECGPGGGYCLASGHSITYSVTLENFEAMLAAGRKYGKYPINIE